jgi:oligosaccharyltransferase complex subunit gamma
MRILKALIVSLLPLAALGAKKPAADRFQQFHTKALASVPLKLDDSIYDQLTASPRDYSVAVLLTALESRFGCQLCREFQPEWDLLAKSWTKGDKKGESRLVYGTLDFMDGRKTFQSVSWISKSCMTIADFRTAWSPDSTSHTTLPANFWPTRCCRQRSSKI